MRSGVRVSIKGLEVAFLLRGPCGGEWFGGSSFLLVVSFLLFCVSFWIGRWELMDLGFEIQVRGSGSFLGGVRAYASVIGEGLSLSRLVESWPGRIDLVEQAE